MSLSRSERAHAALFLGLSLAAALIAGLMVWASVAAMEDQLALLRTEETKVPVIVAAHTLAQGHPIGVDDVAVRYVPRDAEAGPVLRTQGQVLQRVAMERILAGEMIREERLADRALGPSMAALIPKGMRAISVNLSGGAAVAGFLEPGNHVDVLVTVIDQADPQTTTLLEAIRVLAVDERLGAGSDRSGERRAPAVSLLLSPDDAEKLTHAVAGAKVALVLRSDVDMHQRRSNDASVE